MDTKLTKLFAALDASLVLAVSTGILYVCGHITKGRFYAYFNVPLDYIDISTFDLLLSGSYQIPYMVSLLVIILIINAIGSYVGGIKKNKTDGEACESINNGKFRFFYMLLIATVVLLYCWLILTERATWYGLIRAEKYAYECAPMAHVQFKTTSKARQALLLSGSSNYGLLEYTKDKYIFFEPRPRPESASKRTFGNYLLGLLGDDDDRPIIDDYDPFIVHIVDSDDVESIAIIGSVSHHDKFDKEKRNYN